jgi:hypothetical protein
MTATYEKIATTTLGSATNTVTFSSISGSYTDLVVICNGGATATSNARIAFNGDNSGTSYSNTYIVGDGSAISSGRTNNVSTSLLNSLGYLENDMNWSCLIQVMNYSNSTTYKTFFSRANQVDNGLTAMVGLWRSTSAITSLTITCIFLGSENFQTGTSFTLYGIKAE